MAVSFVGKPFGDAEFKLLARLTDLEILMLDGSKIDKAAMKLITQLTKLRKLTLYRCEVSDAALEHLKALTNLQTLFLNGTSITDAGVEHLKSLTKLKGLFLNGSQITDTGVKHLNGLTNLQSLGFNGTSITDAGVEHLKGLTNLQGLGLNGTLITDAGVEHLKSLTKLKELFLNDTSITDAGVEHLKSLTNLQILSLVSTSVTASVLKELKTALPECRIKPRTTTPSYTPPQSVDKSTPQSVFDAAFEAHRNNDYRTLWTTSTETKRAANLGFMAYQGWGYSNMMKQARDNPDLFGKAGPPKSIISKDQKFRAILKKHGLSLDQIAQLFTIGVSIKSGVELGKLVKDDASLSYDLSQLYKETGFLFPAGKLVDLQIDGDRATAKASDLKQKVSFRKTDEGWLLD